MTAPGLLHTSTNPKGTTHTDMADHAERWLRPMTTKLYLHPPKSKRMITLWPDFKIVDSRIASTTKVGADAFGVALAFGPGGESVDWRETRIEVRADGAPIHRLNAVLPSGIQLSAEAVTGLEDVPDVSWLLTFQNYTDHKIQELAWVIPRYGNETYMMGIGWDGYCSYEPRVEAWGMLPASNAGDSIGPFDDERDVAILADPDSDPDSVQFAQPTRDDLPLHLRGARCLALELQPGSRASVTVSLTANGQRATPHAALVAEAENFWETQLSAAQPALADLEPRNRAVLARSLLVQNLQMLARHADTGKVAVRQGGISRGSWPAEAVDMLQGFVDFGMMEAAGVGYRYFASTQMQTGADKGMIVPTQAPAWGGNTGAYLSGLALFLLTLPPEENADLWNCAELAYEWIKAHRVGTDQSDDQGVRVGLLEPMQSTDWEGKSQNWTWTDGWNVLALRRYSELLAHHDHPRAEEALLTYTDYFECVQTVLQELVPPAWRPGEELLIPDVIGSSPTDPVPGPYFLTGPVHLLRAGVIDPASHLVDGIQQYFSQRGLMRKGLTGLMTDSLLLHGTPTDPWAGHMWYTTYSEIVWFNTWIARGELARADETLLALLSFAASPEGYVAERYADNDPTFAPWQPNASGNGRLLSMMRTWTALGQAGRLSRP